MRIALAAVSFRSSPSPSAGLVVSFGYLAMIGGARPTVEFVLDRRTTAAYVAGYLQPVQELLEATPGSLLVVLPFAFIAIALYAACRPFGRSIQQSWPAALAAVAGYGILVLSKDLTRPGMAGTMAMIMAAGVAILLASDLPPLGRLIRPIATGAMAGALVLQAQPAAWLSGWARSMTDVPHELGELVDGLSSDRGSTPWLHANLGRTQLARYTEDLDASSAIRGLLDGGRLFVLGDAQYLYPLVGTDPYWMISLYDMSPVAEQKRVIDLLGESPPAVVAVDRRDISFDKVPNVLRTPLVYRWVIDHYRFDRSVGPYDLHVPRRERAHRLGLLGSSARHSHRSRSLAGFNVLRSPTMRCRSGVLELSRGLRRAR